MIMRQNVAFNVVTTIHIWLSLFWLHCAFIGELTVAKYNMNVPQDNNENNVSNV